MGLCPKLLFAKIQNCPLINGPLSKRPHQWFLSDNTSLHQNSFQLVLFQQRTCIWAWRKKLRKQQDLSFTEVPFLWGLPGLQGNFKTLDTMIDMAKTKLLFFQVLTFAPLCGPPTGGRMVLTAPYGIKEEGSLEMCLKGKTNVFLDGSPIFDKSKICWSTQESHTSFHKGHHCCSL